MVSVWTLIIIKNVFEQQISILYDFWRSCDTEAWSNDAENTALITEINDILKSVIIQNSYLKLQ